MFKAASERGCKILQNQTGIILESCNQAIQAARKVQSFKFIFKTFSFCDNIFLYLQCNLN